MKKIMSVFGTRPEAIKMCPLIKELKERKNIDLCVCVTAQHREMLDSVLSVFNVKPDYDLNVMKKGQSLYDITTAVLCGIGEILHSLCPDIVLVHGDTSTAYAAALACFYAKIPVAHVETGLRSHDSLEPYPEEFNRRSISMISSYDFAPTEDAKGNLIREGKSPRGIFVTGNTGIDALRFTVQRDYNSKLIEEMKGYKTILLTMHRRENIGEPMRAVFRAVRRVCVEREDIRVIYPMHPNPFVREIAFSELLGSARIYLTEPLDVIDFHNIMARSYFVMSDSGGIQEEAPSLSKPVLVLRKTTERPEGIESGVLRLAGVEEKKVYKNMCLLLDSKELYKKMSSAPNPFGDGYASRKIADIIENDIDNGT